MGITPERVTELRTEYGTDATEDRVVRELLDEVDSATADRAALERVRAYADRCHNLAEQGVQIDLDLFEVASDIRKEIAGEP